MLFTQFLDDFRSRRRLVADGLSADLFLELFDQLAREPVLVNGKGLLEPHSGNSPIPTLSSTIQKTLLYVFTLVFTPFHGTLSQQTRRQSQGQGAMLPGWNYALWFVVVRYSSRLNYFSTACVIRSVEVRHARGQQSTASVIGPANYPDYGRSSLPGAQLASGLRAVGHFAGLLAADSRLRRAGN